MAQIALHPCLLPQTRHAHSIRRVNILIEIYTFERLRGVPEKPQSDARRLLDASESDVIEVNVDRVDANQ